ncbi:MAG TPA: glutathione peroxidase [Gemmataceae bacterium]
MNTSRLFAAALGLAVLAAGTSLTAGEGGKKVTGPLDHKVTAIDGKEMDLSQYKGKVVLLVNVASRCGYTPQYEGLQALYQKYKDKGLVVIGVPSNDFGKQEPGTNEQIAEFCKANYGVTFPMLAKVKVKGEGKAPLYQYLTSKETNPDHAGEIGWNFEKFLIGRDGKVAGRYKSKVEPTSEELVGAIERELGKSNAER